MVYEEDVAEEFVFDAERAGHLSSDQRDSASSLRLGAEGSLVHSSTGSIVYSFVRSLTS